MYITKLLSIIFAHKKMLALLAGIPLVIIVLLPVYNKNQETLPTPSFTPSPSPLPVSSDLNKEYTKLNEIVPGKSNLNDVKNKSGVPESTEVKDGKTYFYYKTPIQSYRNVIVLQDNVVVYSLENVFGTYRGGVSSYQSSYGAPDLFLFESNDSYSWYVYLKQGFAIKNDGVDIGAILYFIPESKESFMKTFTKDLNLSLTPPVDDN